jgi:hypothetical protein
MSYRTEIVQDEDPQNPRTEWDNLGKMVCFHKKYQLGDKHKLAASDFQSLEDYLKASGAAVILPLYLYDHGGITISTRPFSCPWDSGQIGFIYLDKKDLEKEFGNNPLMIDGGRLTPQLQKLALEILETEVETYNQYLTGDVWGYRIFKGEEEVDSCWGFFGRDYCEQQAKETVEAMVKADEPLFEMSGAANFAADSGGEKPGREE